MKTPLKRKANKDTTVEVGHSTMTRVNFFILDVHIDGYRVIRWVERKLISGNWSEKKNIDSMLALSPLSTSSISLFCTVFEPYSSWHSAHALLTLVKAQV